jgi:hypothetical protein
MLGFHDADTRCVESSFITIITRQSRYTTSQTASIARTSVMSMLDDCKLMDLDTDSADVAVLMV